MSDKIEEIRARHAHDNRDGDVVYPGAHRDRSFLLAEVDHQRADNERLRDALREALSGLRYWVPQTARGLVERNRIMQRVEEELEGKP